MRSAPRAPAAIIEAPLHSRHNQGLRALRFLGRRNGCARDAIDGFTAVVGALAGFIVAPDVA